MMRFSNSASAEGAREENLAIYATNFCQTDPKMMRIYKFRERRRRERRKFGNLCDEFLPSRPENDAVFISASAEGLAKKISRLMRRISAK